MQDLSFYRPAILPRRGERSADDTTWLIGLLVLGVLAIVLYFAGRAQGYREGYAFGQFDAALGYSAQGDPKCAPHTDCALYGNGGYEIGGR